MSVHEYEKTRVLSRGLSILAALHMLHAPEESPELEPPQLPAELPEEYPELEPELDPVVLEQEPQLTGQKVFIIVEDEGLVQPPRFAHAVHEVHTGLPLPSLVALATSASAASLQSVLEPWLEPPFDPPVLVPLPEPLDPACEPPPLEQVPVANLVPHRLVAPAYDWSIGPHIAP